MEIINNRECGCSLYSVALWCGCGYHVSVFNVYAGHEDEAL